MKSNFPTNSKWLIIFLCVGLCQLTAVTADLVVANSTLDEKGGSKVVEVIVRYSQTPDALGGYIVLPDGWVLKSISGDTIPSILPETGSTHELEFAWTSAPASRASFQLELKYPARTRAQVLHGEVILRSGGSVVRTPVHVLLD